MSVSATRSGQHPSTILITGATGGIGAALARSYAQPGRTLILHGRDPARLAAVTRECEAHGAQVHGASLQLRHHRLCGGGVRARRDLRI